MFRLGVVTLCVALGFNQSQASLVQGICKLFGINIPKEPFAFLPPNADLASIRARFRQMQEYTHAHFDPMIEGRRFVNELDWNRAMGIDVAEPWNIYGAKTFEDWQEGVKFVSEIPADRAVDVSLLQEIHQRSGRRLAFHGFEGRRIMDRYRRGEISNEERKELLSQAYTENKEVHGVSHASLRGKFRSEEIDQITHSGSSISEAGERYFTARELALVRENSYMSLDESSVVQVGPDAYRATARYLDVKKVEAEVARVLEKFNQGEKLRKEGDVRGYIRSVEELKKDLISIHPFLDGNGRSIRLLGDLLYRRRGLPPPLYPNEMDLMMSRSDAEKVAHAGMIDYLNEHAARFNEELFGERLPRAQTDLKLREAALGIRPYDNPRLLNLQPDETFFPVQSRRIRDSDNSSPLRPDEIHYNVYGKNNKETIVLIHGHASNSTAFDPVVEELSKKYRVITYDQRGHRYTVERGNDYSPEKLADDLDVLLRHLKVDRVHVVGHSQGARVGAAYAQKYSSKVASVTVEDMELIPRSKLPSAAVRDLVVSQVEGFPSLWPDKASLYEALVRHIGPDEARRVVNYRTETLENGAVRLWVRPQVMYLMGEQINGVDMRQSLRSANAPALAILAPRGQSGVSAAGLKHLQTATPQIQVEEVPGASHSVHYSKPKEFTRLLDNFLQGVIRRGQNNSGVQ